MEEHRTPLRLRNSADTETLTPDERADFWAFCRLNDIEPTKPTQGDLAKWRRSKKRGRFTAILDRRRRQQFGPGRYHAAGVAGWYTNKNHVKGWRGVNPAQP